MQRLEKILVQTSAPKVPEWLGYCTFRKGTQNLLFLKKCKGGDQEKFFKKSPKKYPSLQRAKNTLVKMSLSSNLYPLIVQRLDNILALKAAPKVSEWPSLAKFWQGHPIPAFSEKVQRGDQGKFFKNPPKGSLRLKGP